MAMITIEQWPTPFESGKKRILDAALDAGVPYPFGCASGECGTCKTLVLSGQVTMDRYRPEALSEIDKEQGLILACRARCITDTHLRWLSDAV
jgi:naphthalene 1,2-dioxygenase ferredoxin reductase component